MKKVLILCGGESGEHEVSLQSAHSIFQFIPADKYETILLGQTKNGNWVNSPNLIKNQNDPKQIHLDPEATEIKSFKEFIYNQKIDVIVGMYHDQVLIPFKTLFKYNAINITLGLPFVRVSPDHGVATNIIGKKIANPKSLIESIKFFNFLF